MVHDIFKNHNTRMFFIIKVWSWVLFVFHNGLDCTSILAKNVALYGICAIIHRQTKSMGYVMKDESGVMPEIKIGAISMGDTYDIGCFNGSDGAVFEGFRNDMPSQMLVVLDRPCKEEIESLSGIKLAKVLFCDNGAAFLMFKSECLEFDMSINTRLIPSDILMDYSCDDGNRACVSLIVVDSSTSKIVHIGMFTLPVNTTNELVSIVAHQENYSEEDISSAISQTIQLNSVTALLHASGMFVNPSACIVGG